MLSMRFYIGVNMIRGFKIDELDTIMKIWLKTNIEAHSFISERYWKENSDAVKAMLPDANIFVYEENNIILGFVGLMDNYIAGIFVNRNHQSRGIGKALLNYIKENNSELTLHVYKKNHRGINFYLREYFIISKEQVDENTGEPELVMNWKK